MGIFNACITFCDTEDLIETARFYTRMLGLTQVLDQGGCRIFRVSGNGFLGFCQRDRAASPDGVVLTLVCDDVDGWYERLSDQGVEFETKPAYNPKYKIYHCFLRDPNGYLVEIQRFEDPRWQPS